MMAEDFPNIQDIWPQPSLHNQYLMAYEFDFIDYAALHGIENPYNHRKMLGVPDVLEIDIGGKKTKVPCIRYEENEKEAPSKEVFENYELEKARFVLRECMLDNNIFLAVTYLLKLPKSTAQKVSAIFEDFERCKDDGQCSMKCMFYDKECIKEKYNGEDNF